MRAVAVGDAQPGDTFASFMDLCLVCRACEDVCPSHVPFGRMMEAARAQIEPRRPAPARTLRRLGLDVTLPHKKLLWIAAALQRPARPFLPARVRALLPKPSALFHRLPALTEPPAGVEVRGTVAVLSGCVQDRWFRAVNLATIRVLARSGWRVAVPHGQVCCGAPPAHNGPLRTARRMAARNAAAFAGADHVVVNAAGCGAHMPSYADLGAPPLPVRDLMAFLHEEDLTAEPGPLPITVAHQDACHALRVLHVREEPRAGLRRIPGLELREIENDDRCCGAAGLYNVTQPEMSARLRSAVAEAAASTGAEVVASANPGCAMQLAAGLRRIGSDAEGLHPIQLLDRADGAEPAGRTP